MLRTGNIVLGFVFASCLIAGQAQAANEAKLQGMLDGSYRFTANASCIESVGGFGPRPTLEPLPVGDPPAPQTVLYNEYLTGTITFDGVGVAVSSHTGATMFDGPFFPLNSPVGTYVSTCTYAYTVNDDLSFSMEGGCVSTLPDGPVPEQTANLTGLKLFGYLSRNGDMLVISGVEPFVQHLELSGGYVAERLCGVSGTYFKAGR